jgi:hypothetical protein
MDISPQERKVITRLSSICAAKKKASKKKNWPLILTILACAGLAALLIILTL